MFNPNAFRTFARISKIILMLLLIGFEFVPNSAEGDTEYISQASLQLMRVEIIVNSVYALASGQQIEKKQAWYNLREVLPDFEQEQALLMASKADDIQDLILQARINFLPLVAAAQAIINHPPTSISPTEIKIVVSNERKYLTIMNELVLILPRHASQLHIQLFIIQIIIEIIFISLFAIATATFVWENNRKSS